MALKNIYDLETTSIVEEDHSILVYQDNKLKKLNAKDIFYSKDYVNRNIVAHKNSIISALCDLNVNVPDSATLYSLLNYVEQIDLFEIGVRRLVHNGTDTSTFSGTPSDSNNPKFTSMGVAQSSVFLDRCFRTGDILTIIPSHVPSSSNDLIYAGISSYNAMTRNDFYGGDYASDDWKDGIYPWNSMSKVTDNNGNYFTRCPLYFIKTEFRTADGIDVSDTWPSIPDKYINDIIYEYNFVCKTRLQGYRPAEFFYKYTLSTMNEDEAGSYIYLEDLDCYTIPVNYKEGVTRYCINTVTQGADYIKILTRYHDFSCYEASTETLNGSTVIASKPGLMPKVAIQLSSFRTYCNNLGEDYYIRDIRSYTDFFCLLWDIEFACTNSQYNVNGVSSLTYSANEKIQEAATDTNTIKVNGSFRVNQYICIGASTGSSSVAADRKILSKTDLGNGIYEYTIDGDPVTVATTNAVWSTRYICGSTDINDNRTTIENSDYPSSTSYPFKWNWIENPFANIWKFLDGIHIKHEADANGLLENCIYVCKNPKLYSNSFTGYEKLQYIMPSEFLNSNNVRSNSEGYITQLGYDPNYPWARLTSKVGGSTSTYYADYYYQNSQTSTNGSTRCVLAGGNCNLGAYAGLRCFHVNNSLTYSTFGVGAAFERQGE